MVRISSFLHGAAMPADYTVGTKNNRAREIEVNVGTLVMFCAGFVLFGRLPCAWLPARETPKTLGLLAGDQSPGTYCDWA